MARDTSYNDYVLEQLARVRGVTARSMFSGFGLYRGGVMFGLIASGELYFKVGADNQPDYEAQGSHPFTYSGRGRTVKLPYWRVPDDVLEDHELAAAWAMKAHAVAVKLKKAPPKKKPPKKKPAKKPPAKPSSARSPRAGARSPARASARRAKA